MVKTIVSLLMALAATVPSEGFREAVKEPLSDNQGIIVRVLPKRTETADGNYALEGEGAVKPQPRYEEMKKNLDEKFSRMFELKAELDAAQSKISQKWEEYYALHEKYSRELRRIISAFITEGEYSEDYMHGRPVPLDLSGGSIEK